MAVHLGRAVRGAIQVAVRCAVHVAVRCAVAIHMAIENVAEVSFESAIWYGRLLRLLRPTVGSHCCSVFVAVCSRGVDLLRKLLACD